MDTNLNIYQKLAKVRSVCEVAKKSKKGYNYTYSDIVEILAKVTGAMKKYNLSLLPGIVQGTATVEPHTYENTKFDKAGKALDTKTTEFLLRADMQWTWVNDDKPDECIVVPWLLVGSMPDPSQAMGSGLTYTLRQFLTTYFQIAQDNDVDGYRSRQKEAEEAENREIAEGIISQFDIALKKYLSDHQEKSEEVQKFIKKYAKDAKYFSIKEPELASKLYKDFEEKYIKGE